MVGTIPHSKSVNYTLSVLPLFILIGYLAYHAGMTQTLFEACKRWLGWLPGGLAVATIFAVAGFSAVSGAATAAAAVFARVAIPEMLKAGYDRRLAAGVVAAGATLDSLIPPSAIMVVYAIIVEASIGKLLIAGFIPGLISAICYRSSSSSGASGIPTPASRSTATPGASASLAAGHAARDRRNPHHLRVHAVRLGDADGSRRARRLRGLRRGAPQPHEVGPAQRRADRDGQAHRDDLRHHLGHPDLRALSRLRGRARALLRMGGVAAGAARSSSCSASCSSISCSAASWMRSACCC